MNLYEACKEGNIIRVKELLEQGVDPTVNDNVEIRIAILQNHVDVVKILLQDGRIDPTTMGNWPIRHASEQGYTDIVEALLQDRRVDPTEYKNAAICWAGESGHVKIVKMLLQDGRVEATDNAIKYAATNEIYELLLKYKYRVDGSEYVKAKTEINL